PGDQEPGDLRAVVLDPVGHAPVPVEAVPARQHEPLVTLHRGDRALEDPVTLLAFVRVRAPPCRVARRNLEKEHLEAPVRRGEEEDELVGVPERDRPSLMTPGY